MKIENNFLIFEEKSRAKIFLALFGIALAIGTPITYAAPKKEGLVILLLILVVLLAGVFVMRSIRCVMDKNTGKIIYERGGILDTTFDTSHTEYAIAAVAKVEVKRFVHKGRDSFECRLVFGDNQRIRISPSGISLSQCERLARKVHEFLDLERPVAFVD